MHLEKLTCQALIISLGEEQHSLGGPLRRLQQSLSLRVLAQSAQQEPVGARQLGQEGLPRRRPMVQLQIMVERAVLMTLNQKLEEIFRFFGRTGSGGGSGGARGAWDFQVLDGLRPGNGPQGRGDFLDFFSTVSVDLFGHVGMGDGRHVRRGKSELDGTCAGAEVRVSTAPPIRHGLPARNLPGFPTFPPRRMFIIRGLASF